MSPIRGIGRPGQGKTEQTLPRWGTVVTESIRIYGGLQRLNQVQCVHELIIIPVLRIVFDHGVSGEKKEKKRRLTLAQPPLGCHPPILPSETGHVSVILSLRYMLDTRGTGTQRGLPFFIPRSFR